MSVNESKKLTWQNTKFMRTRNAVAILRERTIYQRYFLRGNHQTNNLSNGILFLQQTINVKALNQEKSEGKLQK